MENLYLSNVTTRREHVPINTIIKKIKTIYQLLKIKLIYNKKKIY